MGGVRAWIFQSRPDRFDLRTELIAGQDEEWIATRYRELMRPGDIVLYWLSGNPDHKGVYGWGRINSTPVSSEDGYSVSVHTEEKFAKHIPVEKISSISELADLLILRMPIGTNFVLQQVEAKALAMLSGSAALELATQQVAE
jgi:hypothetical protein